MSDHSLFGAMAGSARDKGSARREIGQMRSWAEAEAVQPDDAEV